MSCSGGEASLMSDSAVGRPVRFRSLKDEQLPPLRQSLGEMVTLANPLDYHTFVWGDEERQTKAFTAMMSGGYALNLIVLDFPRADRCDGADWMTTVRAMTRSVGATKAKAGIVATLSENMPEDIAFQLIAEGLVPFSGIDEALDAAAIAAEIGAAWRAPQPDPLLSVTQAVGESVTLTEHESKTELSAFGLQVPMGKLARGVEEAVLAAKEIGFPVALKGSGIAHKTEAGAVKLNLASADAVREAALAMSDVADTFLVEKMASRPVAEIIIGAVRDDVVGPVLTIGAGGILVEILEDSAILTLPTSREAILDAVSSLKIARLLTGYRGQAKGDVEALVGAIEATARFVVEHAGTVEEIDINPLMVLPAGQGVVAADALLRMRKS
jgi:acyl-CoA synthetase (NDP forming)